MGTSSPFPRSKRGKNLVVVDTGKITVRIDKRMGALQFFDKEKKLLLAEKAVLPRQIESDAGLQSWVYFDWQKNEKISAKGITKDDLVRMERNAKNNISFGQKKPHMPLLISENGYGIGIATEKTVMYCLIPTYGNYLYTEGAK